MELKKANILINGKMSPVSIIVDDKQHTINGTVFVMIQFVRKTGELGGKQMWTPQLVAGSVKAQLDQAGIESDFDKRVLEFATEVEEPKDEVSIPPVVEGEESPVSEKDA